jgi:hypothetical protein
VPGCLSQSSVEGDAWKIVGLSVYGISLILLFATSVLHHGLDRGRRVNGVLRTPEDDSVFFLIAGTTTPLVLVLFRNIYGWTVLGAAWVVVSARDQGVPLDPIGDRDRRQAELRLRLEIEEEVRAEYEASLPRAVRWLARRRRRT